MKRHPFVLTILLTTLLFTACQREIEGPANPGGGGNPPSGETVTASIRGAVVDENDIPIMGATVTSGTQTTTTDRYGVFRFNNISLLKANGAIKVSRPGYFNGNRSFLVTANRIHNLRIKLIPKPNSGNFPSATGGTITVAGGSKLVVPANAIADANGAAYTGTVNVAMTWIDPTTADFPDRLPGDLRGLTTAGEERGLESFGMIGVELTTPGGQALKIATGKTAELTFPIPAAIAGQAPQTIDLWHFDEATGRWKQEGQATRTGNNYVAQVSHFSFWNCDAPFPVVDLCMTIINSSSNLPMNNVEVRIYRPDNSYGSGYTDSLGNLCGKVPKDEPLVLKIIDRCHNPVYTQNIGPFSAASSLGNVTANIPATVSFTVTGTITNCAGANVTSGAAIVYTPSGHSYTVPVTAGTFSVTLLRCDPSPVSFTVIGVDYTSQQQGVPVSGTGTSGTVNVGTVQACGSSTAQYLDFLVDGAPFVYATPADNFMVVDSSFNPPPNMYTVYASNTSNMTSAFTFTTNGVVATGVPISYCYITVPQGSSATVLTPSPTLNITSIGPPQVGFIEGNFNLDMDFAGTARNVICNFRIRRP